MKSLKSNPVLLNSVTYVLFLATDLREVVRDTSPGQNFNLVVPDGTWRQAKRIYKRNDALQRARKVRFCSKLWSRLMRYFNIPINIGESVF